MSTFTGRINSDASFQNLSVSGSIARDQKQISTSTQSIIITSPTISEYIVEENQTIQEVIDEVGTNATVLVPDGEYKGFTLDHKSVTVKGIGTAIITSPITLTEGILSNLNLTQSTVAVDSTVSKYTRIENSDVKDINVGYSFLDLVGNRGNSGTIIIDGDTSTTTGTPIVGIYNHYGVSDLTTVSYNSSPLLTNLVNCFGCLFYTVTQQGGGRGSLSLNNCFLNESSTFGTSVTDINNTILNNCRVSDIKMNGNYVNGDIGASQSVTINSCISFANSGDNIYCQGGFLFVSNSYCYNFSTITTARCVKVEGVDIQASVTNNFFYITESGGPTHAVENISSGMFSSGSNFVLGALSGTGDPIGALTPF